MPGPGYAYVGEVYMAAFNFPPAGSYLCSGQILAISANTVLFTLLGTTYGGNGTTDFALPDLRSRFVIGAGQGSGLTQRIQGASAGAETVTLSPAQIPAHSHALNAAATAANAQTPLGTSLAQAVDNTYSTQSPATLMNAASIGSTGGGDPFGIIPPCLPLTFLIAAEGIYPSE